MVFLAGEAGVDGRGISRADVRCDGGDVAVVQRRPPQRCAFGRIERRTTAREITGVIFYRERERMTKTRVRKSLWETIVRTELSHQLFQRRFIQYKRVHESLKQFIAQAA